MQILQIFPMINRGNGVLCIQFDFALHKYVDEPSNGHTYGQQLITKTYWSYNLR